MHPPHLPGPFFIIIIISFVLIYAPKFASSVDEHYLNCNGTFACGSIENIGYPFWGSDRPKYCGFPGFQLNCSDSTPEITIMSATYHVLGINNESRLLTLAGTDYLVNVCPTLLINTTLNPRIFEFTPDTQYIDLYYHCPPPPTPTPNQGTEFFSNFTCNVSTTTLSGYFLTGNLSELADLASNATAISGFLGSCGERVVLAANQSEIQSVETSQSLSWEHLVEALVKGFGLQWKAHNSLCDRCRGSGGQCGHDSVLEKFSCYCTDRPHDFVCPTGSLAISPPVRVNKTIVPSQQSTHLPRQARELSFLKMQHPFRPPPLLSPPLCSLSSSISRSPSSFPPMERIPLAKTTLPPSPTAARLSHAGASKTSLTHYTGRHGPSYCGPAKFRINCTDNGIPELILGSLSYRIIQLDQNKQSMTLSRSDPYNTYTQEFANTNLSSALFNLSPDNQNLSLLYEYVLTEFLNLVIVADKRKVPLQTGLFIAGGIISGILLGGWLLLCYQRRKRIAAQSQSKDLPATPPSSKGLGPTTPSTTHSESIRSCSSTKSDPEKGSTYFEVQVFSNSELEEATHNFDPSKERVEAFLLQYGSLAPKRFSYSDIKKITNSFKDKLGQGGYGSVYKGELLDGHIVAVKVLRKSEGDGQDFINEVASISRTSHVNIVTLMGFCYERSKRALVYEFMHNGSLDKFIYNKGSTEKGHQLAIKTLYEIALGIGRGLEYLHRGCNTRILHFDIKPQNILLDANFYPKISDFGLAKLCETRDTIVSITAARGTCGYVAPELEKSEKLNLDRIIADEEEEMTRKMIVVSLWCIQTIPSNRPSMRTCGYIAPEVFCRNFGGVSYKSDVYSYGMMVLEMIGGRRNVNVEVSHTSEIYFPSWLYKQLENSEKLNLDRIIDDEEEETTGKMIVASLWCIQTIPSNRPSMSKVLEMLQGSLEALPVPPEPLLSSPAAISLQNSNTTSSVIMQVRP
ncbi:hypothetical protein SLEP1_g27362 [Rubroshorea leprosula]|uniref:non-specific serine/threonine protein kinase n=1 Tax=Rubroshorea leprosula TaxID=152421 RepID=A0AAV5JWM7_9ROSI|nr:hypothetical protein SLEP1_g27362 [Rubroshorea leprosula]